MPKPTSPCINLCRLNEQQLCLGCYRTIDEITGWGKASVKRQQAILERVSQRRSSQSDNPALEKLSLSSTEAK